MGRKGRKRKERREREEGNEEKGRLGPYIGLRGKGRESRGTRIDGKRRGMTKNRMQKKR